MISGLFAKLHPLKSSAVELLFLTTDYSYPGSEFLIDTNLPAPVRSDHSLPTSSRSDPSSHLVWQYEKQKMASADGRAFHLRHKSRARKISA